MKSSYHLLLTLSLGVLCSCTAVPHSMDSFSSEEPAFSSAIESLSEEKNDSSAKGSELSSGISISGGEKSEEESSSAESTPVESSVSFSSESLSEAGEILTVDSRNETIAATYTGEITGAKVTSSFGSKDVPSSCYGNGKLFMPGLKAGTYQLTLNYGGTEVSKKDIAVTAIDRSGYAHFGNTEGVGAYTNDGELKNGAVVVYVSDATKNNVSAKIGKNTYTGLVNILNHTKDSTVPVVVRFLDTIKANQFAVKAVSDGKTPYGSGTDYFSNVKETTYEELDGLTNIIWAPEGTDGKGVYSVCTVTSSAKTDSYFNMCDVTGVSNLTVEGIGENAGLLNWGFTFKRCASIEVKNLTFTDYAEDACSFEGGAGEYASNGKSVKTAFEEGYANYFLHHCTFNRGKNNWDLSEEQDKHDGDGSADLKKLSNVTFAYNHFYNCHKTGLLGGSDTQMTRNITFHHNYYEKVQSRLPLGRQTNLHVYNNYYKNCTTCVDMRANSYTLSEANYFEGCQYPHKVTKSSAFSNTAIKSFGDVFDNCKNSTKATIVSGRTDVVKNSCKPDGVHDYSSFDTSADLFYYDASAKKTKASILESAKNAKTTDLAEAGAFAY